MLVAVKIEKTWMILRFQKHDRQGMVMGGFDEMRRDAECVASCLGGIQWFTQYTLVFGMCALIPEHQSPQVLKVCSIYI